MSFRKIRKKRAELRDAEKFLKKWVGTVNARSFGATYPVLKGHLKGEKEKDIVLEKIEKLQNGLRKEGWKVIVSYPEFMLVVLERFLERLRKEKLDVKEKESTYENAKEKGSVREYGALLKLRQAKKRMRKTERHVKHILLSNPEFLRFLKKANKKMYKGKKTELEKLAEKIEKLESMPK